MHCDEVRDRLLDAQLIDSAVDTHLKSCAACRADAARLRHTWSTLSTVPHEEPDSDALRRRFMASLDARRPAPMWRWPLHAAALLAAFGGGILSGAAWPVPSGVEGPVPQEPPMAELRRELGDVRALLTLSLMQQTAAAERLQGVRNAARLVEARPDVVSALLDALRRDPDVNVRLASIRALEHVGIETAVRDGVVSALDQEESPLVSIALMDFVVAARVEPSVATLRRVAGDSERDEAVRDAATLAIHRLIEERR
jgi:hypothetical protein